MVFPFLVGRRPLSPSPETSSLNIHYDMSSSTTLRCGVYFKNQPKQHAESHSTEALSFFTGHRKEIGVDKDIVWKENKFLVKLFWYSRKFRWVDKLSLRVKEKQSKGTLQIGLEMMAIEVTRSEVVISSINCPPKRWRKEALWTQRVAGGWRLKSS